MKSLIYVWEIIVIPLQRSKRSKEIVEFICVKPSGFRHQMYAKRHSKETANMTTPLLGNVFIVNKREKISRVIWKTQEHGES